MSQNLISLEEAAQRLNVDVEAVKQLCEERKLYGVRDGSSWKFKPDEIERYKVESADVTAVFSADDDFDLADDLNTDTVVGATDPASESDLRLADSSGDLNLVDLDTDESGSTVQLGAEALDEDLVLGGSDIAESGIELQKASDSGISLEEEPLILSDSGADSEDDEALQSDDEFNLTPMLELDDDSADASGSQVIALDSDEGFSDSSDLMSDSFSDPLGAPDASAGMMDVMSTAQPGMEMPASPAMTPARSDSGQRFGVGSVLSLSLCFLILALTGVMVYDLMLHMWSWQEPAGAFQGVILDSVSGMF
ncbi:MAG: helix-turn-helix domain-containing protein [Pirellulales bacterium]|nr:helix-turn-helix domain-containing protein [Pirellulales bacterium]